MSYFWNHTFLFFKDIKMAHAIFAMPFAISVMFLPAFEWNKWQFLLIVLAIFFARSFAMGVNRYLDRDIDLKNKRTSKRKLASNLRMVKSYEFLLLFFAVCFIGVSFGLNVLCGVLSIPVLFVLGFYSQLKRFFSGTHFYLGICLALSPLAVSVALTSTIRMESILIAVIVATWVAGFDILYSLQDLKFDRANQLFSVPVWLGPRKAVLVSALCSVISLYFFCLLYTSPSPRDKRQSRMPSSA